MKTHLYLLLFAIIFTSKITSQSTVSQQVKSFEITSLELDSDKDIWVYLPKSYKTSSKTYKVVYMHDGQNLFDDKTSYVGEWHIDELLDSINSNESIIVGIEHGGEKRMDELTPYKNEKYGGGNADSYLLFITNTLKPYIDSTYRTLTDSKNTTIFGSSLGGLVSLYAIIKYPDVFGNAGMFSTAIWINKDNMFDLVKTATIAHDKKFYFLVGSAEGETTEDASLMVSDQHDMVKLLLDKGVDHNNIIDNVILNGHHNETLWSTHFLEAYKWLIK